MCSKGLFLERQQLDFKGQHIISIRDLKKKELLKIIDCASQMDAEAPGDLLKGKILATLFFEPSTRTRLSFESAMNRLGGNNVGFSDPKSSSAQKGESLSDTIEMVNGYADVIVIRHPIEGSARFASMGSKIPIINAGDGANQHPTQTLLDLYTIEETQSKILSQEKETLKIGMVGDLKYGRTVHSLTIALSMFKCEFYFIAPEILKMPEDYVNIATESHCKVHQLKELEEIIPDLDILYSTRIQAERFFDKNEYNSVKNAYVLKTDMFKNVKDNFKILHPLPRIEEIDKAVDQLDCAYYFKQATNGIPVRQAILSLALGAIS